MQLGHLTTTYADSRGEGVLFSLNTSSGIFGPISISKFAVNFYASFIVSVVFVLVAYNVSHATNKFFSKNTILGCRFFEKPLGLNLFVVRLRIIFVTRTTMADHRVQMYYNLEMNIAIKLYQKLTKSDIKEVFNISKYYNPALGKASVTTERNGRSLLEKQGEISEE